METFNDDRRSYLVLTCDATIESYRVAAGNEIVTVRSDLHRAGARVISAWSTLVVRA